VTGNLQLRETAARLDPVFSSRRSSATQARQFLAVIYGLEHSYEVASWPGQSPQTADSRKADPAPPWSAGGVLQQMALQFQIDPRSIATWGTLALGGSDKQRWPWRRHFRSAMPAAFRRPRAHFETACGVIDVSLRSTAVGPLCSERTPFMWFTASCCIPQSEQPDFFANFIDCYPSASAPSAYP